jgi:hypothetical protein
MKSLGYIGAPRLTKNAMHALLAAVLIPFAGWTLSAHLAVLLGRSLRELVVIAPFVIVTFAILYLGLSRGLPAPMKVSEPDGSRSDVVEDDQPSDVLILGLCMVPAVLYFSWTAFWAISLVILGYCVFRRRTSDTASHDWAVKLNCRDWEVVLSFSVAAVLLTLAVSRSDMDDAFYVAIAAFASGNPSEPLLALDPMHGEGTPMMQSPAYQFASFELMAGAIAYLLGIPAMDIMYKALPPLWAVTSVFCVFLMAQEMMPKRWLLLGATALVLIVILGETHRACANFVFVRMFQGKAVYLSVIVPAIFYLTSRYLSARGTWGDLFLLGCTQIAGIGMTGFGIVAAPMAAITALITNIPIPGQVAKRKQWSVLILFAISVPYVIAIAVACYWGYFSPAEEEPYQVWRTVFGPHQQYLVAILLLAGPVLAHDTVLRRRLAIPPFLLFAVFLNPWLADYVSSYVTSPAVYWRVVWSFPVLIYLAASVCLLIDRVFRRHGRSLSSAILGATVIGLLGLSLPFHTLRHQNSGLQWNFAKKKIPVDDYQAAEKAIRVNGKEGRLLAPEEISGVVSRFEEHPKLVCVREMYLRSLAGSFGVEKYKAEYNNRILLFRFVSGFPVEDTENLSNAIDWLNVTTIVMAKKHEREDVTRFLFSQRYKRAGTTYNYSIWKKRAAGPVR